MNENKLIKGICRPHKGNGRKFGYPTANIECPGDLDEGVFVGFTSVKSDFANYKNQPSIIFVGAPEMLNDTNKRLETHILDIDDDDLYGAEINVDIVFKLRNSRRFDSIEDLIEQMHKDEREARGWFQDNS